MSDQPPESEDVPPLSRRESLVALGAGLAGGLAGTALLPGSLDSGLADAFGTPDEDRTAIAESDTPYAVWQYHYDWRGDDLATTSPINLVAPLENASFTELTGVLDAAGWTNTQLEYTLWAWDETEEAYRRPDWTGTETVYGLTGRLHLRAWHIDGRASIQTHVDSPALPAHTVTSYARARATVADIFESAGWTVSPGELEFRNDQKPDHDGLVSVIRR